MRMHTCGGWPFPPPGVALHPNAVPDALGPRHARGSEAGMPRGRLFAACAERRPDDARRRRCRRGRRPPWTGAARGRRGEPGKRHQAQHARRWSAPSSRGPRLWRANLRAALAGIPSRCAPLPLRRPGAPDEVIGDPRQHVAVVVLSSHKLNLLVPRAAVGVGPLERLQMTAARRLSAGALIPRTALRVEPLEHLHLACGGGFATRLAAPGAAVRMGPMDDRNMPKFGPHGRCFCSAAGRPAGPREGGREGGR